jgi:ABC-2 type transport system ATP-binding protein
VAGEVRLDGTVVAAGGRELRERMGVVFQSTSTDPRMTARENLAMSAELHGLRGAAARERVEELLRFAELSERSGDLVKTFSGGMRRRLELARAILHGPEILVMDEPTSGLDESSFRRFWERVAELREREGLTVLLTTHRPEEAERCDRVAVIDEGKVVAEGTPEELRARVAGDVITVEGERPDEIAGLIAEKLGVVARVVEGKVVIERERGHELVPRVVEVLGVGRLASVGMRRPTLADVFLKVTGKWGLW